MSFEGGVVGVKGALDDEALAEKRCCNIGEEAWSASVDGLGQGWW